MKLIDFLSTLLIMLVILGLIWINLNIVRVKAANECLLPSIEQISKYDNECKTWVLNDSQVNHTDQSLDSPFDQAVGICIFHKMEKYINLRESFCISNGDNENE